MDAHVAPEVVSAPEPLRAVGALVGAAMGLLGVLCEEVACLEPEVWALRARVVVGLPDMAEERRPVLESSETTTALEAAAGRWLEAEQGQRVAGLVAVGQRRRSDPSEKNKGR